MLIKEGLIHNYAKVVVTKRTGFANSDLLNAILHQKDSETYYISVPNQKLFEGPKNYIRLPSGINNTESVVSQILSKIQLCGTRLINLADIFQGIVTGANQITKSQIKDFDLSAINGSGIFVVTEQEIEKLNLNKIEMGFVKPWYKNSDIDKWVASSVSDKKLIYIRADDYIEKIKITNLIHHFEQYKQLLINRNVRTGKVTLKDYDEFVKGKRDIPYVMIKSAFKKGNYFCISYARDSEVFQSEKIVCPQFSNTNKFAFDDSEWFAASDVYFIKNKSDIDINLKYILAIINSKLCYFWLYHRGQRKGKTLQLFKGPLSEIPIVKLPINDQKPFIDIVNMIIDVLKSDNNLLNNHKKEIVKENETKLDNLIYALYGLTDEEIELVETNVKHG